MIEGEIAFVDTTRQLLDVMETFLKESVGQVIKTNKADFELYAKISGSNNMKNVEKLLENDFQVLSYDEAMDVLKAAKPKAFKVPLPTMGGNLSSEHEMYLVEKHCKGVPVFIVDWHPEAKPFYARVDQSNNKIQASKKYPKKS